MTFNSKFTLKNFANETGFSVTTISRVLNGKASKFRISKDTELKILSLAKEFGYHPNKVAQSLRLKKSNVIGILVPDISNPFFSRIVKIIENNARTLGFSILLCDSMDSTELEINTVNMLINREIDGIILAPVGDKFQHLVDLKKTGLPMVTVDRHFDELECPHVISDNYQGTIQAMEFLIKNGHKAIGCIQGFNHCSVNNNRVRGYRETLIKYNITVDESLIIGNSFGEKNGYAGTKILLNRADKPTAIIALSNLISLGALRAIKEEGLSIPDDISLISFDDQPYFDYMYSPITSIKQVSDELGQIAFNLLMKQITLQEKPEKRAIILPTKFIKRSSVKNLLLNKQYEKKYTSIIRDI